MAKSAFAKRLASMQKKYEAAQAPAGFGETNLEPGKYRATIGCELKDVGGKMAIEWKFTVVEGDFEGESSTQLDGLENENSFGYLKKRLKMFGYDPEDVNLAEQLETILEEINEKEIVGVIQVKQNGDYLNTYLNKVELTDDEEDEEEETAEEASEEEAEESDEDENDSEEEAEEEDEEEEEEEEEAEEEEEEATIEKGSTVLYQKPKAKKAEEFEVLSVDEKKKTAKLKGIPTAVPLSELSLVEAEEEEEAEEEAEEVEDVSDDDEDDDTVELEVGSEVSIDVKGRPMKGKVLSIDADSETAKVKSLKDGKTYKVSFEQITAL